MKEKENFSYVPSIGKSPERNNDEDIFEHMYGYKDKYKYNRETLTSKIYSPSKSNFIDKGTQKLMTRIKVEVYTKLFRELDKDNDDLITGFTVNTDSLSKQMKEILKPIISELKQENESLTSLEFVKAMDKLYSVIK
jgi:hypothetical protein